MGLRLRRGFGNSTTRSGIAADPETVMLTVVNCAVSRPSGWTGSGGHQHCRVMPVPESVQVEA
jgi:hypothetical protein